MNSELDYVVRDLQRRIANMIRRGTIHSVDFEQEPPRVRVNCVGGAVTGWLPWGAGRTGYSSKWDPLKIGESVMVLSESGELSLGVVWPSLPTKSMPVPDNKEHTHVTKYEDGTTVTYDREAHKLSISVVGPVDLNCTGTFNAHSDGNMTLSSGGNMTLSASRIDLN